MSITRLRTEHDHPHRTRPAACFVLHSTGSLDEEATIRYYRTSSDGVTPHYLILPVGEVRQFVDLDRIAYHVGLPQIRVDAYRAGTATWIRRMKDGRILSQPYPGYSNWISRWPGSASPLDLATGEHPNGASVGIEMLSERGQCTDAQYSALGELLRGVGSELGFTLDRTTILGHYDADPIARASEHGGTDPGPRFDWDRVYDLVLA